MARLCRARASLGEACFPRAPEDAPAPSDALYPQVHDPGARGVEHLGAAVASGQTLTDEVGVFTRARIDSAALRKWPEMYSKVPATDVTCSQPTTRVRSFRQAARTEGQHAHEGSAGVARAGVAVDVVSRAVPG